MACPRGAHYSRCCHHWHQTEGHATRRQHPPDGNGAFCPPGARHHLRLPRVSSTLRRVINDRRHSFCDLSVQRDSKQISLQVRLGEHVNRRAGPDTGLWSNIRAPSSLKPPSARSIPDAGKSGSDLPAGTGIASVFPGEVRGSASAGRDIEESSVGRPARTAISADPDRSTAADRDRVRRRVHAIHSSPLPGKTATTHSPSGDTAPLSRMCAVVTGSRPVPSFLMRTNRFVVSSSERKIRSPPAPNDT